MRWRGVSYAPLADVFRAIAPRERRHTELGVTGLADDRRHRGRPRRRQGRDRLLAAQGRRQLRHRQLRPVRDAEALRTPPPPERGAARRLDRPVRGRWRPSASPEDSTMTVDVTTKPRTLESYVGGEWVRGTGTGPDPAQRRHRRPRRPDQFLRRRLRRRPRLGPRRRRSEAAQALLPRARRDAEGARPVPDGPQGGVLRREPRHRRHPRRRLDRHRGRRRHACSPMPRRRGASCRTPASSPTASRRRRGPCTRSGPAGRRSGSSRLRRGTVGAHSPASERQHVGGRERGGVRGGVRPGPGDEQRPPSRAPRRVPERRRAPPDRHEHDRHRAPCASFVAVASSGFATPVGKAAVVTCHFSDRASSAREWSVGSGTTARRAADRSPTS